MPLNTKTVKGIEYVYFRSYDSETKKHVDTYIGRKDEVDAIFKADAQKDNVGAPVLNELIKNLELRATLSKIKALTKTLEDKSGETVNPQLVVSLRKDIVSIENALPSVVLPDLQRKDRLPSKESRAIRRLKTVLADSSVENKSIAINKLKQIVREAEETKKQ